MLACSGRSCSTHWSRRRGRWRLIKASVGVDGTTSGGQLPSQLGVRLASNVSLELEGLAELNAGGRGVDGDGDRPVFESGGIRELDRLAHRVGTPADAQQ